MFHWAQTTCYLHHEKCRAFANFVLSLTFASFHSSDHFLIKMTELRREYNSGMTPQRGPHGDGMEMNSENSLSTSFDAHSPRVLTSTLASSTHGKRTKFWCESKGADISISIQENHFHHAAEFRSILWTDLWCVTFRSTLLFSLERVLAVMHYNAAPIDVWLVFWQSQLLKYLLKLKKFCRSTALKFSNLAQSDRTNCNFCSIFPVQRYRAYRGSILLFETD